MRRSVRSCRLATLRPPMPTTRPTRRRSGLSPRVQGGVPGRPTVGAAPPPKSCLFAPDRLGVGYLGRDQVRSAEASLASAGVHKSRPTRRRDRLSHASPAGVGCGRGPGQALGTPRSAREAQGGVRSRSHGRASFSRLMTMPAPPPRGKMYIYVTYTPFRRTVGGVPGGAAYE